MAQNSAVAIAGRYTVTFSYDGDFDLPDHPADCRRQTPSMVLNALESGLFELVDFNLSGHYDPGNAQNYLRDTKLHRSIVEMTLLLTLQDLGSRDAIFKKCLSCFRLGELEMVDVVEKDVPEKGMLQSIIRFE